MTTEIIKIVCGSLLLLLAFLLQLSMLRPKKQPSGEESESDADRDRQDDFVEALVQKKGRSGGRYILAALLWAAGFILINHAILTLLWMK